MKKARNIALIVELLLLFVILLFVITTITKTFMASRNQSLYARHLTEAVCLAQEVAEVAAAAEDRAGAVRLLESLEQTEEVRDEADGIGLDMTFSGDEGAERYHVQMDWNEEDSFVQETIRVYFDGENDPLYTLDTGDYKSQGKGGTP